MFSQKELLHAITELQIKFPQKKYAMLWFKNIPLGKLFVYYLIGWPKMIRINSKQVIKIIKRYDWNCVWR